jgi:hypothetical protein
MLMAIIILVGAFAANANSQSAGAQKVVATIPFAFNVGNKNLPAGKYTIIVLNPTSDRRVLQIRSADGRSTAITHTTGVIGQLSEDAKLTFHRYGDRYFFAQAQMAGETTRLAALTSSAERVQRQMLALPRKPSVIVVIAE